MKSIQTKIIVAAAALIAFSVLSVLGIAVYDLNRLQQQGSNDILTHMGNENILEIDNTLNGIEKAVDSIFYFVYSGLHGGEEFFEKNESYSEFIKDLREMVKSIAENTEGVMMAYLRFDPKYDLTDPGFLYLRNNNSGGFEEIELI